jgi:hypothetical protein
MAGKSKVLIPLRISGKTEADAGEEIAGLRSRHDRGFF